ncbi:MAG: DUF4249 domain-containing protein [Bacteroidales bacterium]|nr:DUF4249 domain-containing protein [Bacteroidales bacterium]
MKYRHGYLVLHLVILFISFGCERIIDYPIPPDELKVVINSIINTDSVITINLSKSISILDNNSSPYIQNAQVSLYKNNEPLGLMSYTGNGYYTLEGLIPEAHAEYQVVVNAPGESEATASCVIPLPVPIVSIDTVRSLENDYFSYNNYTYDVILTIDDPAGITNYYELILFQKSVYYYEDTTYQFSPRSYLTDDKIFEYYRSYNDIYSLNLELGTEMTNPSAAYFSDKLLDGAKFTLKITLEHWNQQGMYYFCLRSLSEDYYRYIASLAAYSQADGNPLSERVQIHSNIHNGLGIFGGYSSDTDSIYVEMH